eukprot:TRINITY_DN17692_c0_g1_i1.p1 TRINITY_DN17692_c0_g1~~TRINITY_DN17692_c0_g1_i1.p1  ORF type:complete len:171 (+),score=9.40 TRINITY_DN17692_c0_g1_i1:42-515(+)
MAGSYGRRFSPKDGQLLKLSLVAALAASFLFGPSYDVTFFNQGTPTGTTSATGSMAEIPATRNRLARIAEGPNFLKVALRPKEYRAVMKIKTDGLFKTRRGSWYPGTAGPRKVMVLSGQSEELLALLSQMHTEIGRPGHIFTFLVPRAVDASLIGIG